MDNLILSQLVFTRISHDLIGNIGSISNALELLEDSLDDIEDIKAVAHNILRHRIIRNYKAEADGVTVNDIIDKLLNQ